MLKNFCDRCNAELKVKKIEKWDTLRNHIELCERCHYDLSSIVTAFLKNYMPKRRFWGWNKPIMPMMAQIEPQKKTLKL